MRRSTSSWAITSSVIGSAVEWYDFYLYTAASGLVLKPLFFPNGSDTAASLAVFGTYAAGFVARPAGGLIAGHLGDRVGRKRMMVATLAVMGVATCGVGLLPTYRQVGAWAPALLIALRVLQGLSIGGEWGGGLLMVAENSPPGRRGALTGRVLLGFPVGVLASSSISLALAELPRGQLYAWGWRIPFLVSAGLLVVAVLIRTGLGETALFQQAAEAQGVLRSPVGTVLRRRPGSVLLGALTALGVGSVVAFYTVYLQAYTAAHSNSPRIPVIALAIAAALQCLTVLGYAALSDRVGCTKVMVFGFAVCAVTFVPSLSWLASGRPLLITLAYVLAISVGHGAVYGCLASYLIGLFGVRTRFSALGLTYQTGASLSSFGPLAATAVAHGVKGTWPVVLLFTGLMICAATAVLAASPAAEGEPYSPLPAPPTAERAGTTDRTRT
ncbi:MFS transporter [Streptomyces sp. NPDC059629]|uniref:MFS transporter n=1 Tax=Streptomyces sp. NPDC059629 TaxID=3346889 RepID=UPI0036C3CE1E